MASPTEVEKPQKQQAPRNSNISVGMDLSLKKIPVFIKISAFKIEDLKI